MSIPLLAVLVALCLGSMVQAQQELSLWDDPARVADFGGDNGEEIVERGSDGRRDRSFRKITRPTLTVYLPEPPAPGRAAVVICPGGGYGSLALDKEGHDVARRLNRSGVAAFVLKYRLPTTPATAVSPLPAPVQDVHRAVRMIRTRAHEWDIDPRKVGVMGFSAGGHAAGTAATRFDEGNPAASDPVEREPSRPDFAILIYPVVSLHESLHHGGTRRALLGESPPEELAEAFSTDRQVTARTPPLFLVHAEDDRGVTPEHSRRLAAAAEKAGVPCELLIVPTGGHGFGLGKPDTPAAAWPAALDRWMHARGIIVAKSEDAR
jgi:acetyl esterase/lipase